VGKWQGYTKERAAHPTGMVETGGHALKPLLWIAGGVLLVVLLWKALVPEFQIVSVTLHRKPIGWFLIAAFFISITWLFWRSKR